MGFPTPLLDARLAREKKQNEADRQRLLPMTVAWLEENAARYGIESGYAFGAVTECDRFNLRDGVLHYWWPAESQGESWRRREWVLAIVL